MDATRRRWINQPFWSTKSVLDSTKSASATNHFGALLNALFGYNDSPNFITVTTYALYWVLVLMVGTALSLRRARPAEKQVDRHVTLFKVSSGLTLFWYLITFIWACSVSQHPFQVGPVQR